MSNGKRIIWGLIAIYSPVSCAQATIIVETVPVGNAGNAPDTRYDPIGKGAVTYAYRIGKYEITAGQYVEFLNAVAKADPYNLYHTLMSSACGIARVGSPGSYVYSVPPDWANRPVTVVSWGDAARFTNWLHNGQPTGPQGLGTTEDGSYFINGVTSNTALAAIIRKPGATWAVPSDNEWYKAAYHKNDGVTGNYWDYATRSDALPDNGNPGGDSGNSANFIDDDVYAIGSPYYKTEVGHFGLSASPYFTFDQAGNVFEWNENVYEGSIRGLRGGSWNSPAYQLPAPYELGYYASGSSTTAGFRVVEVPEPTAICLLILGGLWFSLTRTSIYSDR